MGDHPQAGERYFIADALPPSPAATFYDAGGFPERVPAMSQTPRSAPPAVQKRNP